MPAWFKSPCLYVGIYCTRDTTLNLHSSTRWQAVLEQSSCLWVSGAGEHSATGQCVQSSEELAAVQLVIERSDTSAIMEELFQSACGGCT